MKLENTVYLSNSAIVLSLYENKEFDKYDECYAFKMGDKTTYMTEEDVTALVKNLNKMKKIRKERKF